MPLPPVLQRGHGGGINKEGLEKDKKPKRDENQKGKNCRLMRKGKGNRGKKWGKKPGDLVSRGT